MLQATNGASRSRSQQNFVNIAYWPVDDRYRTVIAYPDSAFSRAQLGIPSCPPYLQRSQDAAVQYWETTDFSQPTDWMRASQGNRFVACYQNHTGTDIVAPAQAPVYAIADGRVLVVEDRVEIEGQQNAAVTIQHHRVVDDARQEWTARYVHLEPPIPLVPNQNVLQGQMLGYIADFGSNTHLHLELYDGTLCADRCQLNPWGPIYLWLDDNMDGLPDPASAFAPTPKDGINLLVAFGEQTYLIPYTIRTGRMLVIQALITAEEATRVQIDARPPEHGSERACVADVKEGLTSIEWHVTPDEVWHNVLLTVTNNPHVEIAQLSAIQDRTLWQEQCLSD